MCFVDSIVAKDFEEWVTMDMHALVEFYSYRCPACKRLAPFLEELAEEFTGLAHIFRVNIEDEPQLAEFYGIRVVPTVLFFQEGREVDRIEGLTSPYSLMVKMAQLEKCPHPEILAVS